MLLHTILGLEFHRYNIIIFVFSYVGGDALRCGKSTLLFAYSVVTADRVRHCSHYERTSRMFGPRVSSQTTTRVLKVSRLYYYYYSMRCSHAHAAVNTHAQYYYYYRKQSVVVCRNPRPTVETISFRHSM